MIRRPPRSTLSSSSAASDVYKRQVSTQSTGGLEASMSADAAVEPPRDGENPDPPAPPHAAATYPVSIGAERETTLDPTTERAVTDATPAADIEAQEMDFRDQIALNVEQRAMEARAEHSTDANAETFSMTEQIESNVQLRAMEHDAEDAARELTPPSEMVSVWVPHQELVPREWVWELFVRMDRDGNGRINRDELKRYLKQDATILEYIKLPERMTVMASQWHNMFDKAYRAIDMDSNGDISWDELCQYFEVLSADMMESALPPVTSTNQEEPPEQVSLVWLWELFVRMDKNGDGSLDKTEIIAFLNQNADDAVVLRLPSKFRVGSKQHRQFEKAFQMIDQDKSENVSWEELCAYFEMAPEGVVGLQAERPMKPCRNTESLLVTDTMPLVPEDWEYEDRSETASENSNYRHDYTAHRREFEFPYR
eukprot:TRINITY_DN12631_c0_g1_i2.p1 TRINITY_DN12631_c0_g1~~TRINITY_DN12631_c0_g1_i2.p1  ORF type:complete len:426 (+),score=111.82 TRINITY_DN12631_c0_g1_i2:133-1410(+)